MGREGEGEGRQCGRRTSTQPCWTPVFILKSSEVPLAVSTWHWVPMFSTSMMCTIQLLGHSVLFQNSCPGLPVAGVIYVIAIHFM